MQLLRLAFEVYCGILKKMLPGISDLRTISKLRPNRRAGFRGEARQAGEDSSNTLISCMTSVSLQDRKRMRCGRGGHGSAVWHNAA